MPATIVDVARRARVSTATVSRILGGVGRARPETRERVLSAARDLGYRPSGVARSLKLRATQTLGLIVTDIENPFFPELVRAVEDAARDRGYAILLCNAADDPERESAYLELLVDRRVDGVVIAASSLGTRHREWLSEPPLPVVLVNSTARGLGLPAITSDNIGGGRLAAEHLLALGHRRIGFLKAPPRNVDAPRRLEGLRHALDRSGAPVPVVAEGAAGVTGGEAAMGELLEREPGLTAVVAYNDLMAIGAMRAARAAGRRVPADLSVVGFDDIALAAYVDPPLTTIAQSTAEMGRWAVDQLAGRLTRPAPTKSSRSTDKDAGRIPELAPPARGRTRRLPVRLVVRGSTAPPIA